MKDMKIVVLDGYTANPGDVSWKEIQELGQCEIHDRTPEPEAAVRGRDAEILLTNKTPVSRATIEALPNLRYIGVLATGYNVVDTEAAKERGIPVCNIPEYGTENVAQAVFALILELTNRTGYHADTVRAGRWTASEDFCYWDGSLIELHGLTLGLVGYGRIAQATARIARGFGMNVQAFSRSKSNVPKKESDLPRDPEALKSLAERYLSMGPDKAIEFYTKLAELDPAELALQSGSVSQGASAARSSWADEVEFVSLDRLFAESDFVSLHCPLTTETKEMVNATRLTQMKSSAFLINTARGALVQEQDLAAALNDGRIAGAGLDVLSTEPPPASNPLLMAKNCIITPHIAWATRNARIRLLRAAAENIRAWLGGKPQNVVNSLT